MNIQGYYTVGLRSAYETYLSNLYPNASAKSIKTKSNDSFFLMRWLGEEEGYCYILSIAEPEIQSALIKRMVEERLFMRKNPIKDAKGYIHAAIQLRDFFLLVDEIEHAKIRRPREIKSS